MDEDAKSVRLPKITNMVQPGDVGVFTAAGLPNITGTATQRAVLRDTTGGFIPLISKSDGVFATQSTEYTANTLSCSLYSTQHPTPSQLIIDASRVNSIYGNSTTVQPPAVGAKLYIQVFTSAVPASMAQAGEFINMLEAKADRTELDSYLPLVGGTMTGDILFKSGTGLRMKDASDLLIAHSSGRNADRTCILAGESYHNGASAYLFGSQHASNAGQFSIAANNGTDGKVLNGRPDGTLTWNGQSVLNPIGTVIAFAGNSAPTGYLICNGAAVGRTTYAKLFEVIGTTYGEGDGSTTFNLPNLTNKFIMGSGTAGTSKAAGLPNITGNFTLRNPADYSQSGAFSRTNGSSQTRLEYSSSSAALAQINFSAASSNAIYGKSTTVQPPALTMRFYIKY